MAFPTVTAFVDFAGDAAPNQVTHVVTLPAFVRGDRVLIVFACTAATSGDIITPAGWADVTGNASSAPFAVKMFDRLMTASDGPTLTITTVATNAAWQAYTIHLTDGQVGHGEVGTVAFSNAGSPDPTALDPTWDALTKQTLWVALYVAGLAASNMTAWPLPDNNIYGRYAVGVPTVNLGMCTRAVLAASLDPGPFTVNVSQPWMAWTLAYTRQEGGFAGEPGGGVW